MKFIIFVLCLFILGCKEKEEKEEKPEYDIKFLFEVDGCKIYRFYVDYDHRYFTNCQGSVSWGEVRGKMTREQKIETNVK